MTTGDIDWTDLQNQFLKSVKKSHQNRLADEWNVSVAVLRRLGIGWCTRYERYTFPERDHRRRIIGILRRDPKNGTKKVMQGSKRGLYLAKDWDAAEGPILVPEGVSDTAVLLSRGFAAIGRPSNTAGVDILADLLSRHPKRQVLVLGENDRKPEGNWPGRDGANQVAQKLASQLNREIMWSLPPTSCKDVRDYFYRTGGKHGD